MARKLPGIGLEGRRSKLSLVKTPDACVELLGAPIDRMHHEEAMSTIEAYVNARTPRQVATVNLDFLRIARRNPAFAGTLRGADLALADGMPLVWASKLAGAPLPHRIAGIDLYVHVTFPLLFVWIALSALRVGATLTAVLYTIGLTLAVFVIVPPSGTRGNSPGMAVFVVSFVPSARTVATGVSTATCTAVISPCFLYTRPKVSSSFVTSSP